MDKIENIEKEIMEIKDLIINENHIENKVKFEILKKIKKINFDIKVLKEIQDENYHMHCANHAFTFIRTLSKTKLSDLLTNNNIKNEEIDENNMLITLIDNEDKNDNN